MTLSVKHLKQALDQAISKAPIIPIKTDKGILVGTVLIESCDTLKNIWKNNVLVFQGINLNVAAIKIANNLARSIHNNNKEIYAIDQEYGRWLIDSQIHYKNYKQSILNQDFDRADILQARYKESKHKCEDAKERVNRLSKL